MDWFSVDKQGLAKIIEKRGKVFALFELIQNGWDTNAKCVDVQIHPLNNRPFAEVVVKDDDPEGFNNLTHAYTLFAESTKKGDPEKRGRFNLGEKLVLSLCKEAEIRTTKGLVRFDKDGRSSSNQVASRLEKGSIFKALMRMTREDYAEVISAMFTLLPPDRVQTTINGQMLPVRPPIESFEVSLPTEVADAEGYLRKTTRKTLVTIHETLKGEVPSLYEMGIPVVETGDRWHVCVHQKIPLNVDRDNVTPSYLKEIRMHVLNYMHARISKEDATSSWVRDASAHPEVDGGALRTVLTKRFGEKIAIHDPSDPEGEKIGINEGYVPLYGGSLSAGEWSNIKRHELAKPFGQVTPSPKPYSEDGGPLKVIPEEDWSPSMVDMVRWSKKLFLLLVHRDLRVTIANDHGLKYSATFGGCHLTLNMAKLGRGWFEKQGMDPKVTSLLIHEFAHHFSSDHWSHEFHDACCRLGATLADIAFHNPASLR